MNKSVYKISFFQSPDLLNDEYDKLSDHEKERISELDTDGFFDFEENGCYVCFVIVTPIEIRKYLSILSSNLILFECQDLSNDILTFKFDFFESFKNQLNTSNSIKFSFFVDDLEEWIRRNLEIDMILDRISEVGIDGLNRIEKDFLNNYHKSL